MASNSARKGDRPALIALIGLCAVFISIVGFGWSRMFYAWGMGFPSYLIGLALAIIGTGLAYATGSERAHSPGAFKVAGAYFFVLFLVSALGTINTMFFAFEGLDIIREDLKKTRESFTQLQAATPSLLETTDYDEFRNKVVSSWSSLKAEIENPQRCGQGPEAQKRIAELQEVLPSFKPLASSGCSRIAEMVAAYEAQIATLIDASPEKQKAIPIISLREGILSETSSILSDLEGVRKSLNSAGDIEASKRALFGAAERYMDLKLTLDSAIGRDSGLPGAIDTTSASALGNVGQVFYFIVSRLDHITTYFYVLVALLIDVVLVVAFQRVLRVAPEPWEIGRKTAMRWI